MRICRNADGVQGQKKLGIRPKPLFQPFVHTTCNGNLGHLFPKLPHLDTSVKSLHGFGHRCIKDDVHESKLA